MADLSLDASPMPVEIVDDSTGNELRMDSSGRPTVNQGAAGTVPWLLENRASTIATYSASVLNLAAAATPTDVFTLTGSATKLVKILRVVFSATSTTETSYNAILLKRSTANSAGTSTTQTNVSHDSNNAAATAIARAYTANPTLGTLVGNLHAFKAISPAAAPGQPGNVVTVFDFSLHGQPIVLRGTGEVFSLNLGGVTITGNSFDVSVTWTEE